GENLLLSVQPLKAPDVFQRQAFNQGESIVGWERHENRCGLPAVFPPVEEYGSLPDNLTVAVNFGIGLDDYSIPQDGIDRTSDACRIGTTLPAHLNPVKRLIEAYEAVAAGVPYVDKTTLAIDYD